MRSKGCRPSGGGIEGSRGLGSGEDLGSGWGLQIYRWNYGNGHP